MRTQVLLLLILLSQGLQTSAQTWKKLFDGKTLNGWHTIPGGQWAVRDGMIVGTEEKSDKRHGLLVSDSTYTDFIVKIKYKAVKGNSGLYFRAEKVGGEVGVHGFQAEIDPLKDAGGLYETGGRAWVIHPTPEAVKTWYRPNRWNTMTVTARGGNVVVTVNGKESARLTNDPGRRSGHIALQLHGNMDMEVYFKDLKIKGL
jgi:Domain of Unknown Function (DUF1080)